MVEDDLREMTMGEVARTLARIEQKLDAITSDHEQRLRRVERYVWVMTGVGATGATTGVASLVQGLLL